MHKGNIVTLALLVGAFGFAASAPAREPKRGQPEPFKRLVECRAITDAAARLQCFDGAAASLVEAAERQDLLMVDKSQVQQSRRSLFGLSIPNFKLFGDGDGKDEIQSVEAKLASAQREGDGRWLVRLDDGSTWRQADDNMLGRSPRPGHKIEIKRAALGSYMMKIEGQPGIRVKRVS